MRIFYASLLPSDEKNKERFIRPPLAAGYLASYLLMKRGNRDSHEIITAREISQLNGIKQIAERVLRNSPEIVALSVYLWNVVEVGKLVRELRRKGSGIRIVIGGPEVAFSPSTAFKKIPADWVCTGEGERPFLNLVETLENNPGFSDSLPGMIHRHSPNLENRSAELLIQNLDEIPSPYSLGLIHAEQGGWLNFETMRGCPYGCAFCVYGKNYPAMRYFSLERVERELDFAFRSEAFRLYIMDPTFNFPRKRCLEICRILAKKNNTRRVQIFTEVRAELIDEEMADAFKQAGISHVEIGLQTTDPGVLKGIGRMFDESRFVKGCRLLHERGVWVEIGVIAGLPGDTEASFWQTYDFVANNNLGNISVYPLQVLPGSKYHHYSSDFGIVYDPNPPYYVRRTITMEEDQLKKLIQTADAKAEAANQEYFGKVVDYFARLKQKEKSTWYGAKKLKKIVTPWLIKKNCHPNKKIVIEKLPSFKEKAHVYRLARSKNSIKGKTSWIEKNDSRNLLSK